MATTTKKKVAPVKRSAVKELENEIKEEVIEEAEISEKVEEEIKEIEKETSSKVNFVSSSYLFMARVKENTPKFSLPTINSKVGTLKKGTVLNITFEFTSGSYHMYKTDKGFYVLAQYVEKV